MSTPISPIQGLRHVDATTSVASSKAPDGAFAESFRDAVNSVNSLQRQAHASAGSFLAGESVDVHSVVLDQQRAQIAFDLLLQVRNKAVQAYQEVMRMQV